MKAKAAITIVLLLMMTLCACNTDASVESTADTTPPPTTEAIYDAACAKLNAAANRIISYEFLEQRTVGDDTYTEKVTGTDSYSGVGTDRLQSVIFQTLQYGTYQTDYTESFTDNTAYCCVNGSTFTSSMDASTYLSRQIPAILIDQALYGSITMQESADTVLLKFTQPTALEAWACSFELVELISAYATALLDADGNLSQFHYEASYSCGDTAYQLSIDTKVTVPQQLDLSAALPEHSAEPVLLSYLDAPKCLLQAVGDLFTANSISAQITQALDSKVYTLTQNQQSTLHLYSSDDVISAFWDTSLTITDYRGDPSTKAQTDRYENGTLTRIVDGAVQSTESQTAEQVRLKWENQILNSFFALNYLSNASATDADGMLMLSFTGNEAFCKAVSASFRSVIPNDLDTIAASFATDAAGGYLTIDKATGLPVAMGMEFRRTHVIDGIAYPLSFSLTQTLKLSDASTLDALQPAPEA